MARFGLIFMLALTIILLKYTLNNVASGSARNNDRYFYNKTFIKAMQAESRQVAAHARKTMLKQRSVKEKAETEDILNE